jgi:cell division protein FtsB
MRARTVLVVCGFLAAGLASYAALSPGGLQRLSAQRAEVSSLEADVSALKLDNASLHREARLLQSDTPEARPYLEKAIREELGWVKRDERLLLLEERAVAEESTP